MSDASRKETSPPPASEIPIFLPARPAMLVIPEDSGAKIPKIAPVE
jgi:hypothetical protein